MTVCAAKMGRHLEVMLRDESTASIRRPASKSEVERRTYQSVRRSVRSPTLHERIDVAAERIAKHVHRAMKSAKEKYDRLITLTTDIVTVIAEGRKDGQKSAVVGIVAGNVAGYAAEALANHYGKNPQLGAILHERISTIVPIVCAIGGSVFGVIQKWKNVRHQVLETVGERNVQ